MKCREKNIIFFKCISGMELKPGNPREGGQKGGTNGRGGGGRVPSEAG